MLDVHGSPAPMLVALADGSEQVLTPADDDHYVLDAAFSPDSTLVAMLTIGQEMTRIEIQRVDDVQTVSVTELTKPADTSYLNGITWTDSGLVLPAGTSGEPENVTVFPVDP